MWEKKASTINSVILSAKLHLDENIFNQEANDG